MRFVLGNRVLLTAGGTEVHLLTIGEHLRRLGHDVVLYAPQLGPFADHARRRGLEVADVLRNLPESCDVVYAQDGIVAGDLVERYPGARSIFRICGDVFDFQLPPQVAGVVDLIVVLSDRYERIARACAVAAPVLRMRCPIDVDRLVSLSAIRDRPERAMLLGNYDDRHAVVREAWSGRGIVVDQVGGSAQSYEVATALADADIVVAKSRAALDAMGCGRAVYVYDLFGGDGWVTPQSYPALEADNFAGQATARVLTAADLVADLADYRPEMGMLNRDLVLQHHNARDHVIALLSAIGECVASDRDDAPLREIARLTALQWSWEELAREYRTAHWSVRTSAIANDRRAAEATEAERAARERAELAEGRLAVAGEALRAAETERADAVTRVRSLESQIADERVEADGLRATAEALRGTRVWRLATAWWRLRLRLARSSR